MSIIESRNRFPEKPGKIDAAGCQSIYKTGKGYLFRKLYSWKEKENAPVTEFLRTMSSRNNVLG